MKEERIKEAYRDGIDTLEEYKANKEILQREREQLTAMLEQYSKKPEDENESILLNKIRSAYDIIKSDNSTDRQKHDALTSVVEKSCMIKRWGIIDVFYIND